AQVPQMTLHAVTGHVGRNFQSTLHAAGVPAKVAEEAHKALVYAADLPVRPAAGAWFHVVFETAPHAGAARAPAALRSVTLDFKGRRRSVYRYPVGQDMTAFVEPNGLGMLLAHLADPVPRAHVTSAWGWRIHPILDRPEFHEGIDMAAPMGTPIRAPASGTVVFAGEHGNYGILLKIRHISRLVTAYGHLERIAGGLHDGTYVKKGQVVGYVGSSGLSTGPHLYYEVWVDGRRVNPAQKDIAVPVHLGGARFRKFLSVG
ncbi:MAG: M23 family metallopeptidase, partial [Alphaproteobacteria bacterium]|nr:M23 family metallopeptidase [Alphaproteobacteria bacterium]